MHATLNPTSDSCSNVRILVWESKSLIKSMIAHCRRAGYLFLEEDEQLIEQLPGHGLEKGSGRVLEFFAPAPEIGRLVDAFNRLQSDGSIAGCWYFQDPAILLLSRRAAAEAAKDPWPDWMPLMECLVSKSTVSTRVRDERFLNGHHSKAT